MNLCPQCQFPLSEIVPFCLECGFVPEGEPALDPWHGRIIADRFRLVSKLGAGGMGEVYEAIQEPIGRRVALKVLSEELAENPGQVERFKREAQAASQLTHPNTIVVHDFGQDVDGTLFIAMEFLEGESLDQRLKRSPKPNPEWVVKILSQVCDSLQEAHAAGLVHRDLKPENIFLTHRQNDQDLVKVLDFGIAKVSHSPAGDTMDRLTQQGAICGTPHYMAPEQIRDLPVDHRADIYALGVLLYFLIAGHEPFDAAKVVDLLTMHIKEEPPPIQPQVDDHSEVWRALEHVARHALAKGPEDRPQDVSALRSALTATLGQNVVMSSIGSVTTLTAPPPPKRRLRARVVWGLAVVLLGAAGVIWGLNESTPPPVNAPTPASTEPTNADRLSALFWASDMLDDATSQNSKADQSPTSSVFGLNILGGMEPASKGFGRLKLVIKPSTAKVRLNTVSIPWGPGEQLTLPAGSHQVEVTANGRTVTRRVTVPSGGVKTARFQLTGASR